VVPIWWTEGGDVTAAEQEAKKQCELVNKMRYSGSPVVYKVSLAVGAAHLLLVIRPQTD
jgi:hypothetical protein